MIGLNWKGNFDKPNSNNSLVICHKENIHDKLKWHYAEVRDGVYVMVGGPSYQIMHVVKELLDAYDIDEKDFSVSVRAEKN